MTSIRALLIVVAAIVGLSTVHAPSAGAALTPRAEMLAWLNKYRQAHHLPKLVESRALDQVAAQHSLSMLRGGYFAHTSPGGSTLQKRILASGFVNGYSWVGGENLAWGTGTRALPKSVIIAWMNSASHRANVLTRGYRYVGITRYCGTFLGYRGACVWTADFVGRS
jgi:uncharacterized protein YkwD